MVIHLVEHNGPTYGSWLIARCGARVDRGEDRRFQHLPVTCAICKTLEAEDDEAIRQLQQEDAR